MIVNYPRMRRRAAWPNDLDTALEFSSANPFSISAPKNWDGKLEYTNGSEWKTWDGSEITSGENGSDHCIYLRGTGNSKITGIVFSFAKWHISGTNIACNGDIDCLLDYSTVKGGNRPAMANNCYSSMFYGCTSLTAAPSLPATTLATNCYSSMFYGCTSLTAAPSLPATTLANYCYNSMFYGCTSLTTAPSLPATTLATNCYRYMFQNCTSLTTAPSLPATTLANYCYSSMFYGCIKIKLSTTASGTYTKSYRIPKSGTGTTASSALNNMFANTGGTFKGTPEINTTYYLDESNTIV
nr:MAG TPA: hypothetical protein [Caudoviricetes sp.]